MHGTEDRLLHTLKSRGPLPTQAIARQLGITLPGARKHLLALSESGLVASEMVATGVGRPKRIWTLTERAQSRFPDTHNFLTVELIGAVRATLGEAGLNRLISRHGQNTLDRYRAALGKRRGLRAKISKLSALRSEEGYLAEWQVLEDGTFLLSENNCPICAAAKACQSFCRSELDIFKAVLGPGVKIDRIDHIVSGARRCAYRIASTQ